MNRTEPLPGLRRYEYASRGGQTQPSGYTLSAGTSGVRCIIPAGSAVSDPDAGAIVWWPLLDERGAPITVAASGNVRDDWEYRLIARESATTTGSGVAWVAGITTDTAVNATGILHGISYAAANRAARAVRISGGAVVTADDASPSAVANVTCYGNSVFNSPAFPGYCITSLATAAGDPGVATPDSAAFFHNAALTGALYAVIVFYRSGTVASDTTVEVDVKLWARRWRTEELYP